MDSEFLHTPNRPSAEALVLTHGAGANCRAALLVKVAEELCGSGMLVLRCDLPFRRKRPFGPPSPAGATADRAGLKEAVLRLRGMGHSRVFAGGHSYGGRQASMLAAEEPGLIDGLLLLPYPLHPPEKPEQLRTAHFPALRTPSVFVHGTKDPFGGIEEMQMALGQIPAVTRLIPVPGAGHDLKKGSFDMSGVFPFPA